MQVDDRGEVEPTGVQIKQVGHRRPDLAGLGLGHERQPETGLPDLEVQQRVTVLGNCGLTDDGADPIQFANPQTDSRRVADFGDADLRCDVVKDQRRDIQAMSLAALRTPRKVISRFPSNACR